MTYNFLGFDLKSPIWVASQCPTNPHTQDQHLELFQKYIEKGASLVKTQMISNLKIRPNNNRNRDRMCFLLNSSHPIGIYNLAPIEEHMNYLDEGKALLKKLERLEVPIVANIAVHSSQFNNVNLWVNLAKEVINAGAEIIEVNLSCPNLRANMRVPGQNYDLTVKIVKELKREIDDIPIVVKFTPDMNMARLEKFTKGVINAGVDGITVVNAPVAIAPPDIYNKGKPKFKGVNCYPYTAIHGPVNIHLAYRFVTRIYQIMKEMGKQIELTATGGIDKPEQVVELMMLGASTVEISSAIILQGYDFIKRCVDFFDEYAKDQGYTSINDIRGISHKYIGEYGEVDYEEYVSKIDYDICTNCGLCTKMLCLAWKKIDGKVVVDKSKCSGCGACEMICPVGARKVVKKS